MKWQKLHKALVCLTILVGGATLFIQSHNQVNPDPTTGGGDPRTYYELANRLLEEQLYAEAWPDQPFRAWRPPLYPAFIAILLQLGSGSLNLIIFIQYSLLLFSGGLAWYLFYRFSGSFYGGAATCILFFLYSPFYFYASFFYSETLFNFLMLFQITVTYQAIVSGKSLWFAISGFLFAASILTRTINLPLFILVNLLFILLIVYHHLKKQNTVVQRTKQFLLPLESMISLTSKNLLSFLFFSWILLGGWSIRNYFVLNEFVLVNTANGLNSYFGTRTDLYKDETGWQEELWRVSDEHWQTIHHEIINPLRAEKGEVGSKRVLSQLAISNVLENPSAIIKHKLQILYRYIFPNLNASIQIVQGFLDFGRVEFIIHTLFFIGVFTIVYRGEEPWLILMAIYFLFVFSSTLSFFSERFVIVTMPYYFMISAYAGYTILNLVQGKLTRKTALLPTKVEN